MGEKVTVGTRVGIGDGLDVGIVVTDGAGVGIDVGAGVGVHVGMSSGAKVGVCASQIETQPELEPGSQYCTSYSLTWCVA